jgi:hypothetical protein
LRLSIWMPDDVAEFIREQACAERRRITQQTEYILIKTVREAQQKSDPGSDREEVAHVSSH